jgi:hypothetical protein
MLSDNMCAVCHLIRLCLLYSLCSERWDLLLTSSLCTLALHVGMGNHLSLECLESYLSRRHSQYLRIIQFL